jgi:hypothetical protein
MAIHDAISLLKQACKCNVSINDSSANILLVLPKVKAEASSQSRFSKDVKYPYTFYPDHDYQWLIEKTNNQLIHQLSAPSHQGIANGIYGLLQEKLSFFFYHPKETIVPDIVEWPLNAPLDWKAIARFDKKGFHLHTMHPIELTEQLLDEKFPEGMKDVKEYIDWLARNNQNYLEFNLLESINRKRWPAHAREIVEYAHSRGILMGIDVSLHMIQQKAFQLYQTIPNSFRGKKKQIERNLDMLFQAQWDYVNMEFSSTEFTSGNMVKKEKLRLYIIDLISNKHQSTLFGRKHVVQEKNEIGKAKKKKYIFSPEEDAMDKKRGIMAHTVMFYTLQDEKAPVYENENLKHILNFMLEEDKIRETWYFPESAYWCTFDNSIPLTLLPYLSARLEDIELCDSLGIKGHLTFSSGWEWGYWLFDWSIARWSWKHEENNVEKKYTATGYVQELFNDSATTKYISQALELQQEYIKDKEMIKYLASPSPTDEMFAPFNKEFQPRPRYTYKYIRRKANIEVCNDMVKSAVHPMTEFTDKTIKLSIENESIRNNIVHPLLLKLFDELHDGIVITALRSKHRALTLEYILERRKNDILLTKASNPEPLLADAKSLREKALRIVSKREKDYRYPLELIAAKRKTHTCYPFGYLYTVNNLHFWYREEEQARKNHFGPFYKIPWNIPRTIGLIN